MRPTGAREESFYSRARIIVAQGTCMATFMRITGARAVSTPLGTVGAQLGCFRAVTWAYQEGYIPRAQ
jgi:hypothetical protein